MGEFPGLGGGQLEKLGTGSSGLAGAVPHSSRVQLERRLASSGHRPRRALCVLEPASRPLCRVHPYLE